MAIYFLPASVRYENLVPALIAVAKRIRVNFNRAVNIRVIPSNTGMSLDLGSSLSDLVQTLWHAKIRQTRQLFARSRTSIREPMVAKKQQNPVGVLEYS